MKIKELRLLVEADLKVKLEEFNKNLMELEFKRHSGVEKPHLFKETKKTIARIHTLLNEKREGKS